MSRPAIEDSGLTIHCTECGELEMGPHGLTLVFTEDRGFTPEGPTTRRTVARIAISAPAAQVMVNKIAAALGLVATMQEGRSASKN